jgi:1-acyl-sn-glycerol-3-phosphate acyltransferase
MWMINRLLVHLLFHVRAHGLEHWPEAPFQLVANHHNGFDPLLIMAIVASRGSPGSGRRRPISAVASRTG